MVYITIQATNMAATRSRESCGEDDKTQQAKRLNADESFEPTYQPIPIKKPFRP